MGASIGLPNGLAPRSTLEVLFPSVRIVRAAGEFAASPTGQFLGDAAQQKFFTGEVERTDMRYGNWVGKGWWGGSELDGRVGALPPEDSLDAIAQKHDFAYETAEEMGRQLREQVSRLYGAEEGRRYGEAETARLMALADAIATREANALPQDPRQWDRPPRNIEKARIFRDRVAIGLGEVQQNLNRAKAWRGPRNPHPMPMDEATLNTLAQQRVDRWNRNYAARRAQRSVSGGAR